MWAPPLSMTVPAGHVLVTGPTSLPTAAPETVSVPPWRRWLPASPPGTPSVPFAAISCHLAGVDSGASPVVVLSAM
jgi:hypothetical protein